MERVGAKLEYDGSSGLYRSGSFVSLRGRLLVRGDASFPEDVASGVVDKTAELRGAIEI